MPAPVLLCVHRASSVGCSELQKVCRRLTRRLFYRLFYTFSVFFLGFGFFISRGQGPQGGAKKFFCTQKKKKRKVGGCKKYFCTPAEFPPRCTGVYFGTPQYFSRKELDFYRDSGCTKVHPEKNGVLRGCR